MCLVPETPYAIGGLTFPGNLIYEGVGWRTTGPASAELLAKQEDHRATESCLSTFLEWMWLYERYNHF